MGIDPEKVRPTLWDKIFTVLTIVLSTGAFTLIFTMDTLIYSSSNEGNPYLQLLWSIIYGISFLRLVFSLRYKPINLIGNSFVMVLLILALSSMVWSVFPLVTLQRFIALLGTYLFALYLIQYYEWTELLGILCYSFGIIEIISILFVIFWPDMGRDPLFEGAWRGVFQQKNGLGGTMILAFILWAFEIKRHLNIMAIGFLMMSILLIIFSTSTTGLLIFPIIFLFTVLPIRKILGLKFINVSLTTGIVILLGLVSILIYSNYDFILDYFDKDISLSGRTVIWQLVWDAIQQHFWRGYGYGAFWLGWKGPSSNIWLFAGWEPTHAHNGLLEAWLQLGFIGVIFITLSYIFNLIRSLKVLLKLRLGFGHLSLVFLIYLLLYNFDESKLLVRNSFVWIIYVYLSVKLNSLTRQARGRYTSLKISKHSSPL